MDASELLARYAAGERDFSRVDLIRPDLRRANLKGAELAYICLSRADLSGANLSGADLNGADLSEADLSRSNLTGACLSEADLSGTDLSGTDLSEADLSEADLSEAYLIGAYLIRANLSRAELTGVKLSGANLSGTNLSGARLTFAKLSGANLSGTNLSGAGLLYAELSGANLKGADLSDADMKGANLSQANLFETDLTNTNLSKAKLDGTILAYQKVSEELQRENQELRNRLDLFETQIENLVEHEVQKRLVTNQGISAKKSETWNRLRFRSKAELEIAKVLDEMGVMYFPNASGRVMSEDKMVTREVDFLVCSRGKWGILECDGEIWHLVNSIKKGKLPSAASDHKRDNDFNRHGQWFIKRFTAEDCEKTPHKVARQFLDMLHKFHEDQRYLAMGDSAIEITNGSLLEDMNKDHQRSLGANQSDRPHASSTRP